MEAREKLKRRTAYRAYSSAKYKREYFDEGSGGYLVIERQRIAQGQQNKQEKAKFEKELAMCQVLAQNGYVVEMLREIPGVSSPDIILNGVAADLKRVVSHNNIVKHAKKAVREQGAEVVLFEVEAMSRKIHEELNKLKTLGIKVKYFTTENRLVVAL